MCPWATGPSPPSNVSSLWFPTLCQWLILESERRFLFHERLAGSRALLSPECVNSRKNSVWAWNYTHLMVFYCLAWCWAMCVSAELPRAVCWMLAPCEVSLGVPLAQSCACEAATASLGRNGVNTWGKRVRGNQIQRLAVVWKSFRRAFLSAPSPPLLGQGCCSPGLSAVCVLWGIAGTSLKCCTLPQGEVAPWTDWRVCEA